MSLRLRRGTRSQYNSATITYDAGEPVFVTDEGKLYIGDGITAGGVLINPSLSVDSETVESDPAAAVETVVVERSRSTYEIEESDAAIVIDLATGNNFKITTNQAHIITFRNIGAATNGQSGYIIIDATTTGSATITAATNIFASATGNIAIQTPNVGFLSYTVDGVNIYITNVNLVATV